MMRRAPITGDKGFLSLNKHLGVDAWTLLVLVLAAWGLMLLGNIIHDAVCIH